MISISISTSKAEPLVSTGNSHVGLGHQMKVYESGAMADGRVVYLYFTPETAKQWISALAPIATKEPL